MCTYQTTLVDLDGSGKTANGWQAMSRASVYVDHPVHFASGHAVMIDVLNPELGPSARVALEMDAASAQALAEAILHALAETPSDILLDTHRRASASA
jgi:Family of unknown function (DUF6295)